MIGVCSSIKQAKPNLAYKVLRTDMESLRQKRFDDEAVYPDQERKCFSGVQTVVPNRRSTAGLF